MSDPAPVDLSSVSDPDVRRALRLMQQTYETRLVQQQTEIEALLEMLIEKHVGSIGEFKRHLMRIQQKDARGARLHEQITAMQQPPVAAPRPGTR